MVTFRTIDGVGYYDLTICNSVPSNRALFPNIKLGEVDETLEVNYGQLIDDVVHVLCIKPMTHSALLSALPHRSPGCLLRKAPPYPPQNAGDALASAPKFVGSRKDNLEEPLFKILQQIATVSRSGNKRLYTIKPEVVANRFNRFYFGYKQAEEIVVSLQCHSLLGLVILPLSLSLLLAS